MSEFRKMFLALVALHADGSLVPFVGATATGEATIHSLALSANQSLRFIQREIRSGKYPTWGFAFNRWCQANQGTTRGSVMTWLLVEDGVPSTGVIEYDEGKDGLIIDPPREDCAFWNAQMSALHAGIVGSRTE